MEERAYEAIRRHASRQPSERVYTEGGHVNDLTIGHHTNTFGIIFTITTERTAFENGLSDSNNALHR